MSQIETKIIAVRRMIPRLSRKKLIRGFLYSSALQNKKVYCRICLCVIHTHLGKAQTTHRVEVHRVDFLGAGVFPPVK